MPKPGTLPGVLPGIRVGKLCGTLPGIKVVITEEWIPLRLDEVEIQTYTVLCDVTFPLKNIDGIEVTFLCPYGWNLLDIWGWKELTLRWAGSYPCEQTATWMTKMLPVPGGAITLDRIRIVCQANNPPWRIKNVRAHIAP